MRITELLDKRSIRIDGAPKSKNEGSPIDYVDGRTDGKEWKNQ